MKTFLLGDEPVSRQLPAKIWGPMGLFFLALTEAFVVLGWSWSWRGRCLWPNTPAVLWEEGPPNRGNPP
jgi:hypothetical protein